MVLTGHIICRTPNVPILPQNVALGTSYNLSDVDFKKTNNGGCLGMHGVTYKLDILKQCGLILTEGCCATDAEYCYYPIGYCKTVSFYNYPLYMYQTDIEGQDTTIINAKQKEDKYKVAYRMLNDFIINHSSNSTIMANQELVLERSMISYYGIFIMHFADNAIDKGRIKGMDNLIKKFASSLYHDMNKVHQYKIPFIKFYRSTGLTLYKLVPILGKLKG